MEPTEGTPPPHSNHKYCRKARGPVLRKSIMGWIMTLTLLTHGLWNNDLFIYGIKVPITYLCTFHEDPPKRDLKAPVFGLRLLLIPDCVKYHLITGRSGILIRWTRDSGGHGQQALHLVLTSSQIFSSLTSWLLSRYYQLHQHSYLFQNISRVIVTI